MANFTLADALGTLKACFALLPFMLAPGYVHSVCEISALYSACPTVPAWMRPAMRMELMRLSSTMPTQCGASRVPGSGKETRRSLTTMSGHFVVAGNNPCRLRDRYHTAK